MSKHVHEWCNGYENGIACCRTCDERLTWLEVERRLNVHDDLLRERDEARSQRDDLLAAASVLERPVCYGRSAMDRCGGCDWCVLDAVIAKAEGQG
mgnify:CR=1 FL=1